MTISFNRIPGLQVGHAQDFEAATGCTVILTEAGAVCGVDQRGGAPGTRETDLLRPMRRINKVHAILLSGGSAFGLAAADGVVRWLEEHNVGVDVGVAKVPIVPAAILFDLTIGRSDIRPDAKMGYAACQAAVANSSASDDMGTIGAGTGATIGSILGPATRMKGGIGTSVISLNDGLLVGALIAVNCLGDVISPETGQIIAGARNLSEGGFADTMQILKENGLGTSAIHENTVIGVVATNGTLSKEAVNKVAQMAHNGLARTIRPTHTMFDGDTIFALATGEEQSANIDLNVIGAFAAEVTAQAVIHAVQTATSLADIPGIA